MQRANLFRTLWAALIGVALLAAPTEFSAVQPTKTVAMKKTLDVWPEGYESE